MLILYWREIKASSTRKKAFRLEKQRLKSLVFKLNKNGLTLRRHQFNTT